MKLLLVRLLCYGIISILSISLLAIQPLTQESVAAIILAVGIGALGVTYYSSKLLALFSLIVVGGYVSSNAPLVSTALPFTLILVLIDLTQLTRFYSRLLQPIIPGEQENISEEMHYVFGRIIRRYAFVFSSISAISLLISALPAALAGIVGGPFLLSIYAVLAMVSLLILLAASQKV